MILVHGEETGMLRLKTELEKQFSLVPSDERPLVFNPKNCAEVCNCQLEQIVGVSPYESGSLHGVFVEMFSLFLLFSPVGAGTNRRR